MNNVAPIEPVPGALSVPTQWPDHYAPDDRADVARVIHWLNAGAGHAPGYKNQRSQTKLARAIDISQSTVNTILLGKYPSPPGKYLRQMLDYISRETERAETSVTIPLVRTSVYELVAFVCARAHRYRDIGLISGMVGVGKTSALKAYAEAHPNVILIEGMTDMNALVFLRLMVEKTGAVVRKSHKYSQGTKADMVAGVIAALAATDKLLVIDEADKITDQALEYARRISDLAEIGLVLAGTEKLHPMVRDPLGRHGQISSRVGFWPPIIKGIKREDAAAIARAAFTGRAIEGELADEVLEAFWQMCDGRARVLAKLIRNVIELGLEQGHALSGQLVYSAGQQLMGLKRPKGE